MLIDCAIVFGDCFITDGSTAHESCHNHFAFRKLIAPPQPIRRLAWTTPAPHRQRRLRARQTVPFMIQVHFDNFFAGLGVRRKGTVYSHVCLRRSHCLCVNLSWMFPGFVSSLHAVLLPCIGAMNPCQISAMTLSRRGNRFSLSPGERAGVRAGVIHTRLALGIHREPPQPMAAHWDHKPAVRRSRRFDMQSWCIVRS